MRLLKGLLYFFLVVLFLGVLIFGLNWDSFETLFQNQDGLAEGSEWVEKTYSLEGLVEYMELNPDHISVVSYDLTRPDTGIYYQPDIPRTMASLGNIFLAIAYAQHVDQGGWSRNEMIPIDTLNRYQLPNIERTTHADVWEVLEKRGKIENGKVSINQVAQMMLEYNDPVFADYLYDRIGFNTLDNLITELGLSQTETPLPFSGLYIAINPHVFDRSFATHMDSLNHWSTERWNQQVLRWHHRYMNDDDYRVQIRDLYAEQDGLGLRFMQERDLYRFFPQSTARELAQLMEQIYKQGIINASVSQHIWELLNWPMEQQQLSNDLTRYAAIYDNRMGILNGIDMGISRYTGAPTAQAVFFDQLPVAFWLHMSSNYMHQDYQQRLIWDPALHQVSKSAFTRVMDSLAQRQGKTPNPTL
jgi:hypothetical protein